MRAYTAPVECLSREELLQKVQELRQGLAELSLQQLIAQREEMQKREAALLERETKLAAEHERLAQCEMQIATREVEVAMREAAVAAREGSSLCGSNSAPQLRPQQQQCQHPGATLESPGCSRIGFLPCTPSPPRLEVPPLPPDSAASSAHSASGGAFYGGGLGALPELQVEDGYTHFEEQHVSPSEPPELRSPLPGGPPPTPPPPARRLSGAGPGSARRLKAMFEKRAGAVDSRLSGASAPGGSGHAPPVTSQTAARNPRRTAPPFPVSPPTLAGRGSGPGPAPKVSLQELLNRDEARRSSQGGA